MAKSIDIGVKSLQSFDFRSISTRVGVFRCWFHFRLCNWSSRIVQPTREKRQEGDEEWKGQRVRGRMQSVK